MINEIKKSIKTTFYCSRCLTFNVTTIAEPVFLNFTF